MLLTGAPSVKNKHKHHTCGNGEYTLTKCWSKLQIKDKMPESSGIKAENLLNSLMETLADSVPQKKSVSFFEEENTISSQMNRLFGRQKPVHKILGGGKSADVLLWRNKKISSGVLIGATAIWVLFEWLNYNFLSLTCFALLAGMLIRFVWSNASGLLNRSPSEIPRIVLPDEFFINIAVNVGTEVNRFLGFLQDVASGRNMKEFLVVVVSLLVAAIIGSWCNFLTVLYIGLDQLHHLGPNCGQKLILALWRPILCRCYTRGMKTKLTTLCITHSDSSRASTKSWTEVYSAKSPREISGGRNPNKILALLSLIRTPDLV
ncbi:reticulon-like protein B8 isoform X2 [Magnolia sinica]|uniref:reticulon-like protein B8 isoform X2 n=1 Tax=Magnolia sinica TaxID=86752 RepID=UPI002658AB3A|nr:reticulon-like protein B8 isoform X2 [Magnolia sinica]